MAFGSQGVGLSGTTVETNSFVYIYGPQASPLTREQGSLPFELVFATYILHGEEAWIVFAFLG